MPSGGSCRGEGIQCAPTGDQTHVRNHQRRFPSYILKQSQRIRSCSCPGEEAQTSDVVCVECAVRVLCVHSRLKKANRSVTQVDASAEQFSNQEPVNYPQTFEHKLPSNCSNFNAKCITLEWAYLNQSVV